MIQLYFLSILCNALAGFSLFSGTDNSSEKSQFSLSNSTFNLVLGILSAVIGILKILSPVKDGVFLLGDLVPAASGIIAGLVLIFGIYRPNTSSASGELEKIGSNLLAFRKPLGIGLMGSAFLHFIFAGLPLL